MNLIIDKQRALKKWSPVLDSLDVRDNYKREWMAEYAEMHSLNENVAYSTLGNLNGMGNVVAAQPSTTPGLIWGDYGVGTAGGIGSGDIGQNLLPVSMKIAAQTIGLDLVAVKPSSSPKIDLLFVDFKYDNLSDSVEKDERPMVFKINCTGLSGLTYLLNQSMATKVDANGEPIREKIGGLTDRLFVHLSGGTDALAAAHYLLGVPANNAAIGAFDPTMQTAGGTSAKEGWLEFLGWSRIDGYPMFRAFRQFNTAANMGTSTSWGYVAGRNTFPAVATGDNTIAGMLNAGPTVQIYGPTDILGFQLTGVSLSLVSLLEDHIPGFSAGWYMNTPMTRDTDEKTYPGVIGPDIFTKTIQVGDIEISSALKRTQIEDIKAATGMDIVQKLEPVLVNELTQTISKQIVDKIAELADKNRISATTPKDTAGVSKFDFDVDTYLSIAGSAPGGETTHSIQRKLIAKLNNASNFIATDGRVGPAQYLVTNGNLASVIQDVAGYTINPVKGANINANGQLYPMGTVGNISIYVDPYQRWDDNRIFLGRKNSVDQPGLLFIPYLMAQSISLISEATWAPRMLIRSRYAIADIGFFPWKQFMTIRVTDTQGVLI